MKKIIFSSVILLALISDSFINATNASSLKDASENLFSGRNELDPIDPMSSSDMHDPEVMEDKDIVGNRIQDDSDSDEDSSDDSDNSDDNKMAKHMNKTNASDVTSSHSSSVHFPTVEELEDQIKLQQKIATKYKKLAETLTRLSKEHGFKISSELIKMVESSYKEHQKVVDINEIMLTIAHLGYGFSLDSKLGLELLNENKKAFKQAIETTGKAVEELKNSLGLKLVFEA